ncbi:MAG: hypothetical protein LBU88_06810 [Treponema sp.]|nr:hypothetical protein [Treponema sp.]
MNCKGIKAIFYFGIIFIVFAMFSSCLGLNMDISMRSNGSGRIVMEYSVPAGAENIGRLDGNENWPIIPVGRADWQRTVSRINGVKLVSFSSRQRQQEVITKVTLDFDNPNALANLLDPSGTRVSYNGALNIILNREIPSEINPDLLDLLRQASSGKKVSISFTSAGVLSNLVITNGSGNEITAPKTVQIVPSGRKVLFSIDTAEIFDQADGLGLRFSGAPFPAP